MKKATLLCLMLSVGAPTGTAQTVTGSLVGSIFDSSNAPIVGAKVIATEVSRNVSRETISNEAGNYTISSMDPGTYQVSIEHPGFKRFVKDRVEITINNTVRVDARLELGQVSETVEVLANPLQIKTDRGDLSQQIQSAQVENLPLSPDRNYLSLLTLVPGSTEPAPVGSAFGNPSGSLANFVNGQNNRANSFQLDGTINNETNVISQSAIVPPPEAIQVIDVSTNAYDVEQGRATGAAVNVGIKSGTNQLHGFVWAYNVNSALGARNSLSVVPQQHTNLNQLGFALGGPIVKNKTFFFGDFQAGRDRRGQNALLDVPSTPFRTGDLSAARNPIYDPLSGNPDGSGRTQFEGNRIPANRISPVAKSILALLQQPNLPGLVNNYQASGSFAQDRNSTDVKVNHKFTDLTNGFIRYSYFGADTSDLPIFGDLGGPTSGGGATAAVGPSRIQSASANLTHVFSPTMVSELRAGLVRVLIQGQLDSDPDIAAKVGIPGINNGDFFSPGLPRIAISGYTALGSAATIPFKIAETSSNFVNNWTKQTGNHSIRWGFDFRDLILNPYQANADPRGQFTFASTITGALVGGRSTTTDSSNAFASFLLGLPSQITRATVVQLAGYRLKQYYMYVQDHWQVSQKLTVNYGLRYEVAPFAKAANAGDQSRYDPATDRVIVAGYGPVNRQLNVATDYRDLAPRIGIAYRIGPKTVLRTGYGIGYIPQSINQLSPKNYPSQVQIQLQGINSAQPAGNIADGAPVAKPVDVSSGIVTVPSTIVLAIFNPKARRGYVQSFNLTVEREWAGFVFTSSYVGTLGTRIPGSLNVNAAAPGSTPAGRPLAKLYGRTADVTLQDYFLSSSYHALQTRVQRRFGLLGSLTASYTFSKSLDYTDAFTVPIPLNIDLNRGPSTFDRTHNLVMSHVAPIPFGKSGVLFRNGPAAAILGGFRLSGILSLRTGTPVNVTGVRTSQATGQGFTNRPNVNGPVRTFGGAGRGELWFDTSVFSDPAPGLIGNVGRNSLRGPGYANYNVTLSRIFGITERFRLNMNASAFNLTNTTHFNDPSGSFTGSFGQITSSFGERQMRIGARLEF